MSRAFEGSAAGALPPDTVLECGVCWWVYDPKQGDAVWDIAPDTAFSDLPDHWRCPSCDAAPDKFMVMQEGAEDRHGQRRTQEVCVAALERAYRAAQDAMIGLPVHNDALQVDMIGFRPFGDGYAGVIVTPWCMNIAYVPADAAADLPGALGSSRSLAFPSGSYSFLLGRMDGIGTVETCSLFSPMDEFPDKETARLAAEAAVEGLFAAPEDEEIKPDTAVTRRFMLTRNGASA